MYCTQCGSSIPENSKFCNECGSPIVEKNKYLIPDADGLPPSICTNLSATEQQGVELLPDESNTPNSYIIDIENIPMPKISPCIGLGISSVLALITAVFMIQLSFIAFIVVAIFFVLFLGAWISSIKDYTLAKKDFKQYKKKYIEEKNAAMSKQVEIGVAQEADQKKRIEFNKKRAEYHAKGIPTCPKCGSPSIATINRGYSMIWGFIGSGKPVNVCQMCGHKWKI